MKTTKKTLIEQLKVTKHEIKRRKEYFDINEEVIQTLVSLREVVAENLDEVVDEFYKKILQFSEMDRLIGDAETLRRLKNHQRNYILTLFDGQYDEEYIHARLRVGVVHNRIGLEPKFYISAVHNLLSALRNIIISHHSQNCSSCGAGSAAVEKILMFDLSITFDTYINSLMDEVSRSKKDLEDYAESLEEVISERTKLLKEQAQHDGLTKLLNQRAFYTELRRELMRGQRRNHATVLVYFDLDNFKKLNDSQGHKRGDEILVAVADAMRSTLRESEIIARYGGDEFCIILPESNAQEAQQVCQRLNKVIKESTEGSGISCSMGIAVSPPDNNYDADSLVKIADKAMYEAKKEPGFSIQLAQ